MSKAIVVLSGGLDSATALALAKRQNDQVISVSFDYGQKHKVELDCARDIARHFGVMHHVATVALGSGGSLMPHSDGAFEAMPQMTYDEMQTAEGPSPTYVPYRNGTFLSLSASYALEQDCETIYAGMHAEDAHNWAYPDCTPEFIGAMQNAIHVGTYFKVRLVCPFTYQSKADIVRLGAELRVPFDLTHSCYEGKRPACGVCPTCIGRLEAFKENGWKDPLSYEFDQYRDTSSGRLAGFMASAALRDSLKDED